MTFGEQVRELRKKKHLSQNALAKLAGVSPRTIFGYEAGTTFPRTEKLLKQLADALDVSVDALINGMREANVHLAAGLPLTWVRKQRESFREYLLRNEKVEYRYNGKDYRVRFVGCSVYPQAWAALQRLQKEKGWSYSESFSEALVAYGRIGLLNSSFPAKLYASWLPATPKKSRKL